MRTVLKAHASVALVAQGHKMAKAKSKFVCQSCGYQSPKYLGRCPNCGAWNSFVEEIEAKEVKKGIRQRLPADPGQLPARPRARSARGPRQRLRPGRGHHQQAAPRALEALRPDP